MDQQQKIAEAVVGVILIVALTAILAWGVAEIIRGLLLIAGLL